MRKFNLVALIVISVLIASCAAPSRYGMSKDKTSGLQIGSVVEKSFFVDSSQFKNKNIKLSLRNVSGDSQFRLRSFESEIESALREKGYNPVKDDSFGIKMDINVVYSGHTQTNLGTQFAFLGGAMGGIAGYRSPMRAGAAAGTVVGATLGSIIGSYITDDTYIIISEVTIGIKPYSDKETNTKTIRFDSSRELQTEKSTDNFVPFREVISTKIAVYAGGRNVGLDEVVSPVKIRLADILKDLI
jgi:hypothetical protein